MKVCTKCKEPKSLDKFSKGKGFKDGIYSICKRCRNDLRNSKGPRNVNKLQAKAWVLKSNYNLTLAQFNELRIKQDYRCAICGLHESDNRQGTLHVDHCHDTGKVRGLLCLQCNRGIGMLRDNAKLCTKAAEYLTCR